MNTLKYKIEFYETQSIKKALEECNWIKARAARKLGITERMIGYKIKKYGIKKEVKSKEFRVRGWEEQIDMVLMK